MTMRRPRRHDLHCAAVMGLLAAGLLGATPNATAADVTWRPTPAPVSTAGPSTIQPLDCAGTTGVRGCGGGWFWRDGWRGYGCYPC